MLIRWMVFLTLLLGALIGLLQSDDALTASVALAPVTGPGLVVGTEMPSLVLASGTKRNRVVFGRQSHGTTLVFSSCTTCDIEYVKRWESAARMRGDELIVVLNTTPRNVEVMKPKFSPTAVLYCNREEGLYQWLGLLSFPAAVIVSPNGVVLAMQHR